MNNPRVPVFDCPKAPRFFSVVVRIALILCATACTPTFDIYTNGYPTPKEVELTWSKEANIYAKWVLARWYPIKIESRGYTEVIDYPEYLDSTNLNVITDDTTAIVTNLDIYNPRKLRYRIVKVTDIKGVRQQESVSNWTIRPYYSLRIENPLTTNEEIKVSLILLSGEKGVVDSPLIETGEVRYIIN